MNYTDITLDYLKQFESIFEELKSKATEEKPIIKIAHCWMSNFSLNVSYDTRNDRIETWIWSKFKPFQIKVSILKDYSGCLTMQPIDILKQAIDTLYQTIVAFANDDYNGFYNELNYLVRYRLRNYQTELTGIAMLMQLDSPYTNYINHITQHGAY